jgi:autotransporter-associated beta strand protein
MPRTLLVLLVLSPLGLQGCLGSAAQAQQWVTGSVSAPGVQYHVFDSGAVGNPVSFHIFLPPQYLTEPQQRFPVLYWLHGSGAQQTGVAPMAQRVAAAIGDGHLPPMITVFPNGLPNGMWVNAASGLQPVESMLVDDLITHVDTTFRTISMPVGRMLDGFSMGGYGAARLGLRYSHRFAGFSMIGAGPMQLDFLEDSPDFAPIETRRALLRQVYGNDPAFFAAESPLMLAALHGPELPMGYPIRQVIGTADSMLRTNREFNAHLQQLDIPHQYVELDGVGHNMVETMNSMGPEFWRFHRETLVASGFPADMVIDVPADQIRTQRQAGYTFLSGTMPLMKTGGGTLVLDISNPYSGVASVLDGTLAITSTSAIASSSLVNLSFGAVLDVSGLEGAYMVSAGQAIAGAGTVLGSVTFGAGSTLSPGLFSTTSGASMLAAGMQSGSLQALAVPEPATFGLVGVGLGFLGLGALRRKRVA